MSASIGKLVCVTTPVTVATAGTPVRLFSSSSPYPKVVAVLIRAVAGNAGNVMLGDDDVDASGNVGWILLDAGERGEYRTGAGSNGGSLLIDVENLYIDATANGDAVLLNYIEVV